MSDGAAVEAPIVSIADHIALEIHHEGVGGRIGRSNDDSGIASAGAEYFSHRCAPRPRVVDSFVNYVTERVRRFPELSVERLLREIRTMGYTGRRTALGDTVREIRSARQRGFEVRFETLAGHQARWTLPTLTSSLTTLLRERRSIWLFSIVLGHSRYFWERFVEHQDLQTVLRGHMQAFEHLGGVPREILYDRMKAAVLGEVDKHIVCQVDRIFSALWFCPTRL